MHAHLLKGERLPEAVHCASVQDEMVLLAACSMPVMSSMSAVREHKHNKICRVGHERETILS